MAKPRVRALKPGPLPLHLQTERVLRNLVASTEPGELLPPELELASKLGVSRTTVRQAMQRLVVAGLVSRTPGRGTVVLEAPIDAQLDFTPFGRVLESEGHDVQTVDAAVEKRPADEDEAEALQLSPGTDIWEWRRVRHVDNAPFAVLSTAVPFRVPQPEDPKTSLYDLLEAAGVHLSRLNDAVSAMGAPMDVARALGVRAGSPVLLIRRTAYDDAGEPVEFTRTYLRSGAGYTVERKR